MKSQSTEAAQTGQLTFALNNPGANNTVYISTDANQLTLVIGTTVEAKFEPVAAEGGIPPIMQAEDADGSLLYIDFSELGLTDAEFNAITVQGTDWTFSLLEDQLMGLAPLTQLTLDASQSFSLTLQNFALAASETAAPQLTVNYFRVDGMDYTPMSVSVPVCVTYPPETGDQDLHDAIDVKLTPDTVVNSLDNDNLCENDLKLTFWPGSNWFSITPTSESDTQFILRFVYAEDENGFGAMMTAEQAERVSVTAGPGASSWGIKRDDNDETPCWTLTPPINKPILGQNGTVEFDISNLATTFQPGPTVVLVEYVNVPSCADGTYSIEVDKLPHVEVESFTATPDIAALGDDGSVLIQLAWAAYDFQTLKLKWTDSSGQYQEKNVSDKTTWETSISRNTTFTLDAVGRGEADNTYLSYCLAAIKAEIKSFVVTPAYINVGKDNSGSISWTVNAPEGTELVLVSSLDQIPHVLTPVEQGTDSENFTTPESFTLTATPPLPSSTDTSIVVDPADLIATASATVGAGPVITSFVIGPGTKSNLMSNMMIFFPVSWAVEGPAGTAVTLSHYGDRQLAMSGQTEITLINTWSETETLKAVAPGGYPVVTATAVAEG